MATTSAVLVFGHVLLTSAPDLVAWGLISLCVLRAELREQPRWWLVAGALAGLATYNKLLVVVLLAGIALGLAIVGPRRRLLSPYVWGGAGLTVLLGAPERHLPADPRSAPADGWVGRWRTTTPATCESACGTC